MLGNRRPSFSRATKLVHTHTHTHMKRCAAVRVTRPGGHSDQFHCVASATGSGSMMTAADDLDIPYWLPTAPPQRSPALTGPYAWVGWVGALWWVACMLCPYPPARAPPFHFLPAGGGGGIPVV